MKEGCVGIPENNPNLTPEVQQAAMEVMEQIHNGEIIPPKTEEQYQEFLSERGLYDGKQ